VALHFFYRQKQVKKGIDKLALVKRLPKYAQIAPVYAVIVLMVYSWTILWFFWKLPSWLFFMSIGEIAVIFAYAMAMNFLESLCVLLIPVLLAVVLPRQWFYATFVVRGTALVLLLLGYSMFFTNQLQYEAGYPKRLLVLTIFAICIIAFLVYILGKIPIVCKLLEALSDGAVIFLYLSIPVSLIALVVVVYRNLF
jgi:hypothetical protein